jgi:hypothetical protein
LFLSFTISIIRTEMSKERILLTTSEFNDLPPNNKKILPFEKFGDNEGLGGKLTIFDDNSYAILRFSRKKEELNWANATAYDFKRGMQFFYDYNFISDGLSRHFGEDPYGGTYKAAISFSSCDVNEKGRIETLRQYGVFHYDKDGKLRAIRSGQITHGQYDSDAPSVNFRQREDGLWSVFPFGGQGDLTLEYWTKGKKPIEPAKAIKADGHEEMFLEMRYSLLSAKGKMLFFQESATGHLRKEIGVPLEINIPDFIQLLGSPNGRWTEVFRRFSSYIEIVK